MTIRTITKAALASFLAIAGFSNADADDPAAADQPPASESPASELNLDVPVPELPVLRSPQIDRDAGVSKIREKILQGRSRSGVGFTGDAGVDEAIEMLKMHGSVLDGSVLDDSKHDPPAPAATTTGPTLNADLPPAAGLNRNPEGLAPHGITGNVPLPSVPSLSPSRQNHGPAARNFHQLPGNLSPRLPSVQTDLAPRLVRPLPVLQSGQSASNTYRVAESLLRTARLLEKTPAVDENRAALIHSMRREASRLLAAPPAVQQSY